MGFTKKLQHHLQIKGMVTVNCVVNAIGQSGPHDFTFLGVRDCGMTILDCANKDLDDNVKVNVCDNVPIQKIPHFLQ
jgi:hypothetical protein